MKCKGCKQPFVKLRPMQIACSPDCAYIIGKRAGDRARAREARKQAQELRKRKEAIKSRKEWMKEALAAFCAWVRKRDEGLACISCRRHHEGQLHGGHYRNTFHYAALAFEPDNCHSQCAQCNAPPPMGMGGNLINYRIGLIARVGEDRIRELEGQQPPKKYTIDELKAIRDDYRSRLKVCPGAGVSGAGRG